MVELGELGEALKTLFSLEGEDIVTLSAEAKEFWRVFHDRTAEEAVHLSEDLGAIWSKLRDTALRLALIMHLSESADRTLPLCNGWWNPVAWRKKTATPDQMADRTRRSKDLP